MSSAVTLGGCRVDLLTENQALHQMSAALENLAIPPLGIASANLDHIHHFGHGRPFEGYLDADREGELRWLTLLDGYPLVRRARKLTATRWPRLAGADLVYPILALAGNHGKRVGFLGGTTRNHESLKAVLAVTYPELLVGGYWAPTRSEVEDRDASLRLAREVREAEIDVLFVALGKPRQEKWIQEFGPATGARVLLAFGASTDFLTGRLKRAPRLLRDNGFEWAHRLSQEPRRLARRYVVQGPGAARILYGPQPARRPGGSSGDEAGNRSVRSLGCLVVTYNSRDHISGLLDSIPEAAGALDVRTVVVDNDSQDDTLAILERYPDVLKVPGGGNLGFAGGLNVGLPKLADVDAVAILNPDLVLSPRCLELLADALRDRGVGIAVPTILNQDGTRYDSLRREPSLGNALGEALFGSHVRGRPQWLSDTLRHRSQYERPRHVEWASGAAWLVARDCVDAVGSWNERYFLYSEETEYARRARRAGYATAFVPEAEVRHDEGGSGRSVELATLLAVNRIEDYGSWHSRPATTVFRLIAILGHLLRSRQKEHRAIAKHLLGITPLQLPRASESPQ